MSAHTAWGQMIARCYDQDSPKYKDYGARGIRVCDRWICRKNFVADMGDRPVGMSLNRKDNDGPYSPENCEWATDQSQQQNRRDNNRLTFNGRTECLTEWARIVGISRTAIRKRLAIGWSVEAALTRPIAARTPSTQEAGK